MALLNHVIILYLVEKKTKSPLYWTGVNKWSLKKKNTKCVVSLIYTELRADLLFIGDSKRYKDSGESYRCKLWKRRQSQPLK